MTESKIGESDNQSYLIVWHTTWGSYERTPIWCDGEPSYEEAAQFVSVKEDEPTSDVRVDAVIETDYPEEGDMVRSTVDGKKRLVARVSDGRVYVEPSPADETFIPLAGFDADLWEVV